MRQLRVRLKHLHIPPSRMQVVQPRIPHPPVPMHLRAPCLRPRRRHHFPQRLLKRTFLPIPHQESPKYVEFHLRPPASAFYAASPICSAGGAAEISPVRERWVKAPARIPQRRRFGRFFSPNSSTRHL